MNTKSRKLLSLILMFLFVITSVIPSKLVKAQESSMNLEVNGDFIKNGITATDNILSVGDPNSGTITITNTKTGQPQSGISYSVRNSDNTEV